MPNVGVIDGTHVLIQAPHSSREWEFVNREGHHTISVQLVGNADLIITNYVVQWPGSIHDAYILKESNLYMFHKTAPDCIHLSSRGYLLVPWLMTSFAIITCDSQQRYNNVHGTTRGTIERLNRVLKHRFACLNCLRV